MSRARQLIGRSPLEVPGPRTLAALRFGWGNTGWSADTSLLSEVAAAAAAAQGPILECGSGLSTLVFALIAERRGLDLVVLEHEPGWYEHVAKRLRRLGGTHVQLHLAPLTDYGEYHWYDTRGIALPEKFSLVLCDGPPGNTPGGRYGLLPVMGDRLGSGTTIFLDDARREGESEVLDRWHRQFGMRAVVRGPGAGYAVVRPGKD